MASDTILPKGASVSTMLIFPDTNFFLQYRSPAELPWGDLTASGELRLLVCRTVQGEVDRFKEDRNSRRAGRARKVSADFRRIIKEDAPVVLRESGPRVVLELAPRIPHDHSRSTALDITRPDDRVVAEVLAYVALNGGAVSILTADTGMMVTARDQALPFFVLPDEWRLPPEKDEGDKRIAELQRKVDRLERAAPMLALASSLGAGQAPGPLRIHRVQYQPLSEAEIEIIVEEIEACFPLKTDFSLEADQAASQGVASQAVRKVAAEARKAAAAARRAAGLSFTLSMLVDRAASAEEAFGPVEWQPPSEAEIEKYNDSHVAWLGNIRRSLKNLHKRLPNTHGIETFSWSLTNSGTVPAEGLVVEIEALSDLLLIKAAEAAKMVDEKSAKLPAVPGAPSWKAVREPGSLLGIIDGMHAPGWDHSAWARAMDPPLLINQNFMRPLEVPDRMKFHWRSRPDVIATQWAFECAEFRHGSDPERFKVLVLVPMANEIEGGAVRFRASARNLPERVEDIVQVQVITTAGDTMAMARSLVTALSQ